MCHLINDVIYRIKQLYKCYCQIGTCIYCTIWIVMYRFWKVSSRHINKHWFELLTARNAVVAPCMSNLRAFRRNCWRHDRAYIWATSLFLSHSSTHIPFCFLLSTPRQFSMFTSHYAISYIPPLVHLLLSYSHQADQSLQLPMAYFWVTCFWVFIFFFLNFELNDNEIQKKYFDSFSEVEGEKHTRFICGLRI